MLFWDLVILYSDFLINLIVSFNFESCQFNLISGYLTLDEFLKVKLVLLGAVFSAELQTFKPIEQTGSDERMLLSCSFMSTLVHFSFSFWSKAFNSKSLDILILKSEGLCFWIVENEPLLTSVDFTAYWSFLIVSGLTKSWCFLILFCLWSIYNYASLSLILSLILVASIIDIE